MTTLEELLVKMDLDSAKYRAELEKMNKGLDGLESKIGKVTDIAEFAFAKKLADSVIHGAEALYSFVSAGAAAAQQMQHLSEITGIAGKSISQLSFIAKGTGTSGEQLGTAFAKLEKQVAAGAGGSEEARAAFKAMGIELEKTPGILRNVGDIVGDLSTKIASYADGAAKTALVQHAMGKGAAEMIPFLNRLGSEGFENLKRKTREWGAELSDSTIRQAGEFKETTDQIKGSVETLAIRIASDLSPAVQNLGEDFARTTRQGRTLQTIADGIAFAAKLVASGATIAIAPLQLLGRQIGNTIAVLGALKDQDFDLAKKLSENFSKERPKLIASVSDTLKGIWAAATPRPGDIDFVGPIRKALNAPITPGTEISAARKALEAELDQLKAKAVEISEAVPKELFELPPIDKAKIEAFAAIPTEVSRQFRDKIAKDAAEVKKIEFTLDGGKFTKDVKLLGAEGLKFKQEIIDVAETIAKMQTQIAAKEIAFKGLDENIKAIETYKKQILDMGGATEKAKISESLLSGELKLRGDKLGLAGADLAAYRDSWIRAGAAIDRTKAALLSIEAPFKHQQQLYEDANAVLKSQESSLEALETRLQSLREMQQAGALDQGQYTRAVAELQSEFLGLADIGRGTASLLTDSFAEFFLNFNKGVKDIAANFAKAMAAMIAKVVAAKLVGGIFSLLGGLIGAIGGGVGAIAGASVGGAAAGALDLPALLPEGTQFAATGADAMSGQPFVVGERGPELFVPKLAGQIIPNDQLAAAASSSGSSRVDHWHHFADDLRSMTLEEWMHSFLATQAARAVT